MTRNYISPEFKYDKVYGTLNMEEESSYFGSKMLEVEDSIIIGNESIVYYQNSNGEQINLEREYDFNPVVFNTSDDKFSNHTLKLDDFQSDFDKNNNARWNMSIPLKKILSNYIFATLKKYRTFEGVTNQMTFNKIVDSSIKNYIDRNVINRYKYVGLDLYLISADLLSINTLKYQNKWDDTISQERFRFTKFSTVTDFREEDIKISFTQPDIASKYSFRYYFNLKFEKL